MTHKGLRLATLFVQLKVPDIENKDDFVLYFNQFLGAGHTRMLVEYSFWVVFNFLCWFLIIFGDFFSKKVRAWIVLHNFIFSNQRNTIRLNSCVRAGHHGPVGLCTCIIPWAQGFESCRRWVPSIFFSKRKKRERRERRRLKVEA